MDHEKDKEELQAIKAVFEKALEINSIEDIEPHTHKDFSFVSFTDRSFKDFASFAKRWKQTRHEILGDKGSFSAEMNPEPSFFYDDIAVCHGCSSNQMTDKNGTSFEFTSNWTVVCKKEEGEWKIVRAHNSLDPFGNPMLIAGVKKGVLKASIITLIIGFVLGVALCRIL